MGVTKLRLARFGCRNRPFYRIVAIDSRKFRDAAPLEYLGTYDPLPFALDQAKEVRMKVDRIKYWLSVGAQPSDRVAYLLWRAGMGPAPPVRFAPQQSKPKEKKSFHTMSDARLAAGAAAAGPAAAPAGRVLLPSTLPMGFAAALGRPTLAAFSGFMTRPSVLR